MNPEKVRRVEIEGRVYEIPDMWLAGFCRAGRSVRDAIDYWHQQALLEELEESYK